MHFHYYFTKMNLHNTGSALSHPGMHSQCYIRYNCTSVLEEHTASVFMINLQILLVACLTDLLYLLSPDFLLPLIGFLGQYFSHSLYPWRKTL